MYFSLQILKSVQQKEVHHGEMIKEAADASGMTVDTIMQRMNYKSRNTFYNHTHKQKLSQKILDRYSRLFKVNFFQNASDTTGYTLAEPNSPYLATPSTIQEAIKQRDYYVKLYWEKLEEIRKLEEDIKVLREEIIPLGNHKS